MHVLDQDCHRKGTGVVAEFAKGRSVKERLRQIGFLRRWRFGVYIVLHGLIRRLVRQRADQVLFLSDTRPGPSGNIAAVQAELVRQLPSVVVRGVYKTSLRRRRSIKDAVRLPWLMARSAIIVLDDYYPLIYELDLRKGTRVVQLWHAAGAMKMFGHSRVGGPGGPVPGSRLHRNYTDAIVSSEKVRASFAEAFDMPTEAVHADGVPRTDVFFDRARVAQVNHELRAELGIPDSAPVYLFAPTYRGADTTAARYPVESLDWAALLDALDESAYVLLKFHPFIRWREEGMSRLPERVINVSERREATELLMVADQLITDYSSIIFEFALLDRPIVFFCPDIEDYVHERDFYFPFEDYLIGTLVTQWSELGRALRNPAMTGSDEFLSAFMGACDGQSSARVVARRILPFLADGGV